MRTKTTEYCVADAVENGLSQIAELRDELENWYENLPESFQNSDKGDTLQTAMDSLEQCTDSYLTVPECVEETEPLDMQGHVIDNPYVGGVRFTVALSTKKRQSRADRRDDAVALLQGALDAMREALDCDKAGEDGDPFADTRDEIEQFCDDLENAISEAEGVEFPRMYG